MKGLIIKDFCNVMRQWKFWTLYFLFMGFISVYTDNFSMIGILVFIMPATAMGAFSYDDLTKWDRYALTMPVSRRKIVLSRYLMCGIMILGSAIGAIVIASISSIFNGHGLWDLEGIFALSVILALSAFYCALQLPIIYKIGPERARVWMMILFLLPFLGSIGFVQFFKSSGNDSNKLNIIMTYLNHLPWGWITAGFGLFVLAAAFVSYQISVHIYLKKEF